MSGPAEYTRNSEYQESAQSAEGHQDMLASALNKLNPIQGGHSCYTWTKAVGLYKQTKKETRGP